MVDDGDRSRRGTGGGRAAAAEGDSRTAEWIPRAGILAAAYCTSGALGLLLAIPPGYATAAWPPSGIALAAVLLWGPRVGPGVWLGSFLVNLWVSLATASGGCDVTRAAVAASIGVGSTLQALLGAALLRRWVGAGRIFESGPSVLAFTAIETVTCFLAPTWGVTTLRVAGVVGPGAWLDVWRTWWLGDLIGVLVVAPLLLTGRRLLHLERRPRRLAEAIASFGLLAASTALVFVRPSAPGESTYSLSFVLLPLLVWIACRFEPCGVALATSMVSLIAVAATAAGALPGDGTRESLLLLQGFTGLATVTALTLAAAVTGHRRSETSLRELSAEMEQLSLTDDLTGIRNRRGFLLLAEQVWRLARRTQSRCVLVFVDIDGLKRVNDTHGHPAGDALIVDAARVLRRVFRESDVIARLGGDEFAVLAVVDDVDGSVAVSRRLQDSIEECNREPGRISRLSMSFGIEELPGKDDVPLEVLVSRADRAMYDQKRQLARSREAPPEGR